MQHRTIRQGDEVYCPVCNLRWGANEEPPADCIPTVRKVEQPEYLKKTLSRNKQPVTAQQWEDLRKWADNGFKDGERPTSI